MDESVLKDDLTPKMITTKFSKKEDKRRLPFSVLCEREVTPVMDDAELVGKGLEHVKDTGIRYSLGGPSTLKRLNKSNKNTIVLQSPQLSPLKPPSVDEGLSPSRFDTHNSPTTDDDPFGLLAAVRKVASTKATASVIRRPTLVRPQSTLSTASSQHGQNSGTPVSAVEESEMNATVVLQKCQISRPQDPFQHIKMNSSKATKRNIKKHTDEEEVVVKKETRTSKRNKRVAETSDTPVIKSKRVLK